MLNSNPTHVCCRREAVRVSPLQQGLQSVVQPHHTQSQTHGLQAVLLRPVRPRLPAEGRPPTPHGDAAPRRGGVGLDRRCCRRLQVQPRPVAVRAYGNDRRPGVQVYSGQHFAGNVSRAVGTSLAGGRRRGGCRSRLVHCFDNTNRDVSFRPIATYCQQKRRRYIEFFGLEPGRVAPT